MFSRTFQDNAHHLGQKTIDQFYKGEWLLSKSGNFFSLQKMRSSVLKHMWEQTIFRFLKILSSNKMLILSFWDLEIFANLIQESWPEDSWFCCFGCLAPLKHPCSIPIEKKIDIYFPLTQNVFPSLIRFLFLFIGVYKIMFQYKYRVN